MWNMECGISGKEQMSKDQREKAHIPHTIYDIPYSIPRSGSQNAVLVPQEPLLPPCAMRVLPYLPGNRNNPMTGNKQ